MQKETIEEILWRKLEELSVPSGRRTASVVQWSEFLATDTEVRVQVPTLPNFDRSIGSGTGSTQPLEYN
jgi:hypothetical protein